MKTKDISPGWAQQPADAMWPHARIARHDLPDYQWLVTEEPGWRYPRHRWTLRKAHCRFTSTGRGPLRCAGLTDPPGRPWARFATATEAEGWADAWSEWAEARDDWREACYEWCARGEQPDPAPVEPAHPAIWLL